MMAKQMRLDRFLAEMGQGTRSGVREQIRKGRVTVNGSLEKKPERKIEAGKDQIVLDGREISYVCLEYYMLNKPAGVLSATEDKKRETVLDLITERSRKDLFPVGRLDLDTEGLLLITNDGELAHQLLSPKNHVDKVYHVKVKTEIEPDVLAKLNGPMELDGYKIKPVKVTILERKEGYTILKFVLTEGRNRQIRKMCEQVDLQIQRLKRVSVGELNIGMLTPGKWKYMNHNEAKYLKDL